MVCYHMAKKNYYYKKIVDKQRLQNRTTIPATAATSRTKMLKAV